MKLSPEEIFFRAFRNEDFDICELLAVELHGEDRGRQLSLCRRAGVRVARCSATPRSMCAPTASRSRRTSRARRSACRNISSPPTSGRAPSWRTISASSRRTSIWMRGGIEHAGRPEKITVKLPPGVRLEMRRRARRSRSCSPKGEIDGFIAPRAAGASAAQPNIGWLFRDPVAAAQGLLQAHRHLPDHASDRRAPDAGREASLAAGGGAQGVRAVEGEARWRICGHVGHQGDAAVRRGALPRRAS